MTEEERRIISAFVERISGAAPVPQPSASPWGGAAAPQRPALPPMDPDADRLIALVGCDAALKRAVVAFPSLGEAEKVEVMRGWPMILGEVPALAGRVGALTDLLAQADVAVKARAERRINLTLCAPSCSLCFKIARAIAHAGGSIIIHASGIKSGTPPSCGCRTSV